MKLKGPIPHRGLRRTWAVVVCLAIVTSRAGGAVAQGLADWPTVLTGEPDPRITVTTTNCPPALYPAISGICITFNGLEPGNFRDGQPALDSVRYGDLGGDGRAEAVVPVYAGGTAGLIGFLVYQMASPTPWLLAAQGGLYHARITIENGAVLVEQPVYESGDPNSVPSKLNITAYRLAGDTLVPAAKRTSDISIRYWAWPGVLASDPGLETGPAQCPLPPANPEGAAVCLSVAPFGSDPESSLQILGPPAINGFVDPASVLYGDLDNDGVDEAVVPVQSGGADGTIGLLIYRQGNPTPALVAALSTYRAGVSIEGGTALVVSIPVLEPEDLPCCPRRFVRATYALSGDLLTVVRADAFGVG